MGPVTVIGGVNVDINGFSLAPLNMADSNPGTVEYCPGGVGRNIAENLHRLGAEVRLISVIGDDWAGDLLRASSRDMGLNIEHSLFLPGTSPVYIALMDNTGEMRLALADMSILDKMSCEHLESKADLIAKSTVVVLDTNLPEAIIRFVLDRFGSGGNCGKTAGPLFFLDPVSARKSAKVSSLTGRFDALKLGRMEAAFLSGTDIPECTGTDKRNPGLLTKLEEAADSLIRRGTGRVFITLGKGGVYFAQADKRFFTPVKQVQPVNTSGGGDAFMAGMVYGTLHGWEPERIVPFAMAMAAITVQSKTTVSRNLNVELVEKTVKSYNDKA
ncbi:carbohydrate kinase [Spirochaetia bacterium]|nr:carbohydrate kinase [Spirochaetia bacterium]